jgi:hypothetical protein
MALMASTLPRSIVFGVPVEANVIRRHWLLVLMRRLLKLLRLHVHAMLGLRALVVIELLLVAHTTGVHGLLAMVVKRRRVLLLLVVIHPSWMAVHLLLLLVMLIEVMLLLLLLLLLLLVILA